jgi:hypothetical protein
VSETSFVVFEVLPTVFAMMNGTTPMKNKMPIHLQSAANRILIKNGTVINADDEPQTAGKKFNNFCVRFLIYLASDMIFLTSLK